MELETRQEEGRTVIEVETDSRVALVLRTEEGERIFLPGVAGDGSSYYADNPSSLVETESGYLLDYPGRVHDVEVIS